MKKNSINLTYVESLLLLTQGVTLAELHNQHSSLKIQNAALIKISGEINKFDKEIAEIKQAKTSEIASVSTKIVDTTAVSGIFSFIDPKLLAGILCAGALYYVGPTLVAKINIPTFKSILLPLKTAAVGLIPYLKEVRTIDSIKDNINTWNF